MPTPHRVWPATDGLLLPNQPAGKFGVALVGGVFTEDVAWTASAPLAVNEGEYGPPGSADCYAGHTR